MKTWVKVVGGLFVLGIIGSALSPTKPPQETTQDTKVDSAPRPDGLSANPPTDGWMFSETPNAMDGSTTTSVGLDATGSIEGWLSQSTPRLIIRCKEKSTDLYVNTGVRAQPELGEYQRATVRLRYGGAEPISQMWSESTDGEALFAGSPIPVAKKIVRVDTVRFQFTPFNASPAIATFVVTGLRPHLERIAAACGWKL